MADAYEVFMDGQWANSLDGMTSPTLNWSGLKDRLQARTGPAGIHPRQECDDRFLREKRDPFAVKV